MPSLNTNASATAALVAFHYVYARYRRGKAAKTLLEFNGDNQQALLEVMTDYFTSRDERRDSDSDEDDVTNDGQARLQGRTRININHDSIMMTMTILKVKLPHTVQN